MMYKIQLGNGLHQWLSGSLLKTGRQQAPGSTPGIACKPNRSEFSVVLSENRGNTG